MLFCWLVDSPDKKEVGAMLDIILRDYRMTLEKGSYSITVKVDISGDVKHVTSDATNFQAAIWSVMKKAFADFEELQELRQEGMSPIMYWSCPSPPHGAYATITFKSKSHTEMVEEAGDEITTTLMVFFEAFRLLIWVYNLQPTAKAS